MNKDEKNKEGEDKRHLTGLVEKNIRSLVNRQIKEERDKPIEERIAERVGHFTGNLAFVYTHAIIFALWIVWNLGWLKLKPFDPSFTGLQLVTAIEAIFLTTFVLISQNSMDTQ